MLCKVMIGLLCDYVSGESVECQYRDKIQDIEITVRQWSVFRLFQKILPWNLILWTR